MLTTLRFAARSLRSTPWFASSTIAVLAIALALSLAAFAIVDRVLFKPLPYDHPAQLFVLRPITHAAPDSQVSPIAAQEAATWMEAVREVPSALVGARLVEFPLDGVEAGLAAIDARFFNLLGVRPLIGGFAQDDFAADVSGADQRPRPVLISYRLWHAWAGGDPSIVGQTRIISDRPGGRYSIRIAGILPPDFVFPLKTGGQAADVIAPIAGTNTAGARREFHVLFRVRSGSDHAGVLARLHGATRDLPRLRAEGHISAGEQRQHAPFDGATLDPVRPWIVGSRRLSFELLFAASIALLLLACGNVASLAAARNVERRREVLIRRALGATVWDLGKMQLAEVALLVGAAAALAPVLARPLLMQSVALLPESMLLGPPPTLDARLILTGAILAAASALAVSAWPLVVAARLGLADAGRSLAPSHRVGVSLLATQIACGFALLICGVLTIASLGRAAGNDAGYARDRMLVVEASVRRYAGRDDASRQLTDAFEYLRRAPGIQRVAVSTIQSTFLRAATTTIAIVPQGWTKPTDAAVRQVSDNFFAVMGLDLIDGRWPHPGEWSDDGAVAMVSAKAARAFWPDGPAIGRTLASGPGGAPRRVIGVVGDARFTGLDVEPVLDVYLPGPIVPGRTGLLYHIQASGSADALLPAVIRELSARGLRVDRAATHSRGLFDSIKDRALPAWLFGLLAASALVVLAIGIGGLLAMTSAQRTREVGIRLALGSTRAGVMQVIVREASAAMAAGLLLGGLASWWFVTLLDAQLYGVSAHQPGLWAAAALALIVVAAGAAAAPALRAARINPADSLRAD